MTKSTILAITTFVWTAGFAATARSCTRCRNRFPPRPSWHRCRRSECHTRSPSARSFSRRWKSSAPSRQSTTAACAAADRESQGATRGPLLRMAPPRARRSVRPNLRLIQRPLESIVSRMGRQPTCGSENKPARPAHDIRQTSRTPGFGRRNRLAKVQLRPGRGVITSANNFEGGNHVGGRDMHHLQNARKTPKGMRAALPARWLGRLTCAHCRSQVFGVVVVACGGADTTLGGDGGNDTGTGTDDGGGTTSST